MIKDGDVVLCFPASWGVAFPFCLSPWCVWRDDFSAAAPRAPANLYTHIARCIALDPPNQASHVGSETATRVKPQRCVCSALSRAAQLPRSADTECLARVSSRAT